MKNLYHYTDLSHVLAILCSDKMEARSSADWDYDRVSFTESEDLWEHGDWRITFSSDVVNLYSLRKMDYSKMTPQYSYEKEWYSVTDIYGVSSCVTDICNEYEYIAVDVCGWFNPNELGDIYVLAKFIAENNITCESSRMWNAFMEFCARNSGYLFDAEYIVYIDYDGSLSLVRKE